ncbi:MAG: TIM barrel protein [Rhodobacteraceae bacterium]|nr:TIM barrel protein [Paracoccaceae bacterium]
MPRFAANLTFLFKEFPFLERFEAAADAGFSAVEVLFPYDDAATEITRRLTRAGLPLALINTPPPNWAGGDRGFAAIPGGEERFRRDFKRTLRYASRLKPQHIHIMAGKAQGPVARDTYLRNLSWAAAQAPGQSLTIEPLNATDMPGYYLHDFEQASVVLAEVGAANLGLQFDAYHAHLITRDVPGTWATYRHLVRHIQVAGVPGRNEPAGGEIDYPGFFATLDAEGYDGFVSGEYNPKGRTAEGLGWIRA